ncbi:hypothetical protein GA0074692_1598 [Micromonospora pallida]|uniref:Uncharacterized protein n=1 Tax=Micromonospora pallida TaxID=145854 RepID=A0A1C6S233_9ACTN|nr:hypothetical protein [Micromonospora pallida]SCL23534.1 hypothetical protein GA0074692_1598 [Micromonospora pallida]
MRPEKPLLTAAATCAALHAVGILVAEPVWRYAEVLSLGLLLAYAVVSGLPTPRWAVPTALTLLLVDAFLTLPADPTADRSDWQFLAPGPTGVDTWSGFASGLTLCWAPLTAVAVLLLAWRHVGWHRRTAAVAAVVAALVTGYAIVRVVDVWLVARSESRPSAFGVDAADPVIAVPLAVLPPLALGLSALALATVLAGHGRWLASAGAMVLVLVALPHLDASIGAVPRPLYAGEAFVEFAWQTIPPSRSMPQPVPALTAAVELTSYLLLVAGLTGFRRPARTVAAEAAGPQS